MANFWNQCSRRRVDEDHPLNLSYDRDSRRSEHYVTGLYHQRPLHSVWRQRVRQESRPAPYHQPERPNRIESQDHQVFEPLQSCYQSPRQRNEEADTKMSPLYSPVSSTNLSYSPVSSTELLSSPKKLTDFGYSPVSPISPLASVDEPIKKQEVDSGLLLVSQSPPSLDLQNEELNAGHNQPQHSTPHAEFYLLSPISSRIRIQRATRWLFPRPSIEEEDQSEKETKVVPPNISVSESTFSSHSSDEEGAESMSFSTSDEESDLPSPKKSSNCFLCSFSATNESELEKHVDKKHQDIYITCELNCVLCNAQATNESELEKHINEKHQEIFSIDTDPTEDTKASTPSELNCVLCNAPATTEPELENHISEKHKEIYTIELNCAWCDAPATNEHELTSHIKEKHDVAMYNM